MTYHMHGSFLILEVNGKYLFLKRNDNGRWDLPGGGFNMDEVDYKKVVLRELEEEAGIKIDREALQLCANLGQRLKKEVVEHYGGNAHMGFVWLHCVTVHKAPDEEFPVSPGNEHSDYRFFTYDEIINEYETFSSGPLWFFFTFLAFRQTGKVQEGMLWDRRFWQEKEYVAP